MSRADAIIKKLNATLVKVTPLTKSAYLRTVLVAGGDSLIGRQGTTTNTDTLLLPQPFYKQLSQLNSREVMLLVGIKQFVTDDYKFILSPTSITEAQLQDKNMLLVLKDAVTGGEEVLKVIYFNNESLNSKDVAYTVIARSISRS